VDPAVVKELLGARRRNEPIAEMTSREREVLALIAEGRSTAGIARIGCGSPRAPPKSISAAS
jgi:DNA-binding CsgD family transcriptional regulator